MSKAEEAAMKAYPPKFSPVSRRAGRIQSEKVDTHAAARAIYRKGYEQAEQDFKEQFLQWAKVQKEKVGIGLAEYDMGKENGKLEVLNALIEKIKEL